MKLFVNLVDRQLVGVATAGEIQRNGMIPKELYDDE